MCKVCNGNKFLSCFFFYLHTNTIVLGTTRMYVFSVWHVCSLLCVPNNKNMSVKNGRSIKALEVVVVMVDAHVL